MFTAISGWFGAQMRRQQSGRMPGRLSFALRLENLEGRATPSGIIGGSEIDLGGSKPSVASGQGLAAYSDSDTQADLAVGGAGVGVDLCGAKLGIASGSNEMTLGGDTGIQVDLTGGRVITGDFGVGVDLNGGRVVGSDFLYGVHVGSTSAPAGHGGETGVGVDLNSGKGGMTGDV
jgi:hypothetical protein